MNRILIATLIFTLPLMARAEQKIVLELLRSRPGLSEHYLLRATSDGEELLFNSTSLLPSLTELGTFERKGTAFTKSIQQELVYNPSKPPPRAPGDFHGWRVFYGQQEVSPEDPRHEKAFVRMRTLLRDKSWKPVRTVRLTLKGADVSLVYREAAETKLSQGRTGQRREKTTIFEACDRVVDRHLTCRTPWGVFFLPDQEGR